jgi:Ner family transcriptional regulator
MAQPHRDWHPEDIKSAIRKTGITLGALGRLHGLPSSACSFTLIRPWTRVQEIIAARIGRKPQDIWPSRYDAAGNPLPRREINAPHVSAPSQKRKAT